MKAIGILWLTLWVCACPRTARAVGNVLFSGERRRNNLVSELLDASSISGDSTVVSVTRPGDGWIFISATCAGDGTVDVLLDDAAKSDSVVTYRATGRKTVEGVRFVKKGAHRVRVDCNGSARVDRLVVKAIAELIHSGLGYDPAIKAFGHYDMAFLERDVLPNVTTLVVPHNLKLPQPVIDDWHRQGKRFIAEVGVSREAKTADQHTAYWTGLLDSVPFADGIIIDEFIINRPSSRTPRNPPAGSPRQSKRAQEQEQYRTYEKALKQLRAGGRLKDKQVYVYFGGSGNTLNQEIIGPTFIRTIRDCGHRIALERYIFERSSEERSRDALRAFVEGITDWNAKESGVNRDMIVAFGLFSMPPGGINKLPSVDYHVWMDQQMHVAANDPALAGISGLEWWTTLLADEETVRFVGKLYRHFAIEGKTEMLTRDPLFLPHLQNADFEHGTEGWDLHPAEAGSIQAKSFPRYGRIEMRYMGLGRPPDPEHIGDTFLWMKRSAKGPNAFSQTAKSLQPGRWYTLEMFSCDYQDLVHPKAKTMEQANKFIGTVTIAGVEIDPKRSFTEMYPTAPEPKIPIWITYHWMVFNGSACSMPDTPPLQEAFGQSGAQRLGCGFPVARLLTLFDASTGFLLRVLPAPLRSHDLSRVQRVHEAFQPNDVVVGDRGFCSYAHLALLNLAGVFAVFRIHQATIVNFQKGRPHSPHKRAKNVPRVKGQPTSRWVQSLGRHDQIVEAFKPTQRPSWMTPEDFARLPESMRLRELRYRISQPGFRVREVTLVTTLLDARRYPAAELAKLYLNRWQIETNLRHLKQTLRMDVLRTKTVDGIHKELAMFAIVYNLVRYVMLRSAKRQGVPVTRTSFIDAQRRLCHAPLNAAPRNLIVVPHRPGRCEPRACKRRPKQYDLMNKPRRQLQQALITKQVTS